LNRDVARGQTFLGAWDHLSILVENQIILLEEIVLFISRQNMFFLFLRLGGAALAGGRFGACRSSGRIAGSSSTTRALRRRVSLGVRTVSTHVSLLLAVVTRDWFLLPSSVLLALMLNNLHEIRDGFVLHLQYFLHFSNIG
tara:strand:- start:212 stop:634 length:423 start_codon:yes stop_codon:yes gene_type:complete